VINLHSHTTFSDGSFTPDRIVKKAAEDGLTHIAITDHFETSKVPSLKKCDLSNYISTIRDLGRKYEGTVRVLAGVEIDANPDRCRLKELPFDMLNDLDLVLFEYVNDKANGGADLKDLDHILSNISVPKGLAHNDIETCFSEMGHSELRDILCSMKVFVELNTACLYRRDGLAFYELAEEIILKFDGMVGLSIGTDIHRQLSEVSNVRSAHSFVERLGPTDSLIF
jgi:histidinol phosphatase-like PHP family hydrolase